MSHKFSVMENVNSLISCSTTIEFVKILYREVPRDALHEITYLDLAQAAELMFELIQERPSYSNLIRIRKIGKTQNIAVVEVVTKDIPFLVESISNELKKNGAITHLVVHQAIKIERKKTGEFISFGSLKGNSEAVMQFFIYNQFSSEDYLKIKTRIANIIECVDLVVQDWQPMRQRMKEAIKNISCKSWYQFKTPAEEEAIKFLEWILEGHLIFLGSNVIDYQNEEITVDLDRNLGMTKTHLYQHELTDLEYKAEDIIFIKKSASTSLVHKDSYMNCIYIKQFDIKGCCSGAVAFLGFFTSSVYKESIRNIPIIRTKVHNILAKYGYHEESYNAKTLFNILEDFSRTDLMQIHEDELFDLATGIVPLYLTPRIKVFLCIDKPSHLVHCFIFMPKAQFGSTVMKVAEQIVSKQIGGSICKYCVSVGESQIARLQISIRPYKGIRKEYSVNKIEELVTNALENQFTQHVVSQKYSKYQEAFSSHYMNTFTAKQAIHDIKIIESALASKRVKFHFYSSKKHLDDAFQLKIFSPNQELHLSKTLPTLENMFFFVLDTQTFQVKITNPETLQDEVIFIHYFRLNYRHEKNFNFNATIKRNAENALEKIWDGTLEDDKFNGFIIHSELTWKEVFILRAYAAYLKQICFSYDTNTIISNLILTPSSLVKNIARLFYARFQPTKTASDNKISIAQEIEASLIDIQSPTTEKVIKAYLGLIFATKRTNFFKKLETPFEINGVSFKISSNELEYIPLPKPFVEIFVYSSRFEAIHLRGGKIARGGVRWSDRRDDFRTEILSLMKAQMTKNAVIVPVGAKGGFILKSSFDNKVDEKNEAIVCYKNFLRGLLDITDNIENDNVIHPADVMLYDDADTYLVVAADKGTASFSDYANSVSMEYHFWLGDAFASGGSAGYDHKKMAITARGAWLSAQEHFHQLGLDIEKKPFTAIGIGDMSGDVFGNGFLLSKQCLLVAAFNHLHIFLDPNPNPVSSFEERQRLFNLPYSQWSDYNHEMLSKGGGIFSRSAKNIPISSEAAITLGVEQTIFTPEDLIKAILKAPVDLLFNGGIGTYVKSSEEIDANIGDKSNDGLRIYGNELRCKVVAEGGNLGLTQLGRVEYARNNGKINTDFIDNSAGVDCSDHEVNIKITFADLLNHKAITLKKRDQLLATLTEEVASLVLKDNENQITLLSLEENRGIQRVAEHFWLMQNLEQKKALHRKVEYLPTHDQLQHIESTYGKLSRPEISVLISYAKNSAIDAVIKSSKPLNTSLQSYLIEYFPVIMRTQFTETLLKHKLQKEIIITSAVNSFINYLGCCFFHQLSEQEYNATDILHAFFIASSTLDAPSLWETIKNSPIPFITKIELFKSLIIILEKRIVWLLQNETYLDNVDHSCNKLKEDIAILSAIENQDVSAPKKTLSDSSQKLSEIINLHHSVNSLLYCIQIVKKTDLNLLTIATRYIKFKKTIGLQHIYEVASSLSLDGYRANQTLRSLLDEINTVFNVLVEHHVSFPQAQKAESILAEYRQFIIDLMREAQTHNIIAHLSLALEKLKNITRSLI